MRIWIDPARLIALNLTANDVQAALLRENVELPSGKISGNTTELTVRTFGKLNTEEEFNNLIVKILMEQIFSCSKWEKQYWAPKMKKRY